MTAPYVPPKRSYAEDVRDLLNLTRDVVARHYSYGAPSAPWGAQRWSRKQIVRRWVPGVTRLVGPRWGVASGGRSSQVDEYPEFRAARPPQHAPSRRLRPKVFFSVVDGTPGRVTSADVTAFIRFQRAGEDVLRLDGWCYGARVSTAHSARGSRAPSRLGPTPVHRPASAPLQRLIRRQMRWSSGRARSFADPRIVLASSIGFRGGVTLQRGSAYSPMPPRPGPRFLYRYLPSAE